MRESLMYGSVRGARGNSRPYRDTRFAASAQVSFWQILLQKSFCTRDQNFFWLYTRLSCKYVGDLIA